MKIKLAILDADENYLNRIASAFSSKFVDKLEVYSFMDEPTALDTVSKGRIDVLIAGDSFEIDVSRLPKRCGFAYFVDSVQIDSYKGHRTICKYQKAELIYKEILSIFSETSEVSLQRKLSGEGGARITTFVSASGGVGSSALAAAFSMSMAKQGYKVLYLNLEQFGEARTYFSGPGTFDFGDVIYNIKSKKSNLSLKLESSVRQGANGVHFYESCKAALFMQEMRAEDYKVLLDDLVIAGYDYIVLDMDFSLDEKCIETLKMTQKLVFVSDGSDTSNQKLERAIHALTLIEDQKDISMLSRAALIYNKFDSKTGKMLENSPLSVIAGIPRFEQAALPQVLTRLQDMDFSSKLA